MTVMNTYGILMAKSQSTLEDAIFLYEKRGSKESAVSRAYYAMYYATEAVLLSKGIVAHSHSGQIAQFSLHCIKTSEIPIKYGKMLSKVLEKRQLCDYEIEANISDSEIEDILVGAEEYIGVLKKYLEEGGFL